MAFCEFSSEVVSGNSTSIDNLFITQFLPYAQENCVRVYLYGLYKCTSAKDNSIEEFEKVLNISRDDIVSIFYFWQEQGLVQVIDVEPVVVRYLPVKNAIQKMKKYNVDKYTSFNLSAQELIGTKMLTPREFEEFYYLIENLKMDKDAVLKIIEYCVKLKGENVAVSYVVAVAKSWAYDGVKTVDDVANRIDEQNRISGDVVSVLKCMGIKRSASIDEYQMFLSWEKDLEMPLELIVKIAKVSKTKNFKTLDDKVRRCYALKLQSVKEVEDYFAMQDSMFTLAKNVTRSLGLWYDDLNAVVDTYISKWTQLGFDADTIVKIAEMSFRASVRTLDGLDTRVNNLFKQGLLTSNAIDDYMGDIVRNDERIVNILNKLGINRGVNSTDRNLYKTWLYGWNLSDDIIDYATTLAMDKYMPMQYMNKILSEYHNAGVKTLDEAKSHVVNIVSSNVASPKAAKSREYTRSELDSLFDDIKEIEI